MYRRMSGVNVLAIDTSTDYLSLAILRGDSVAAKFHKKADMRHSILLVPMIDKLLKSSGLKLKDIDCFAISIGPGSFTGLRIGVTVVKGMAFALKKPIVTVPTLDVIANNVKDFIGIICTVLDARKNKVYACLYKSDRKIIKRISKYLLFPLADLLKKIGKYDKVLFLGDIVEKHNFGRDWPAFAFDNKTRRCSGWQRKGEIAARLGLEKLKKKKFVKPEDLEPLYLYSRECDITGK